MRPLLLSLVEAEVVKLAAGVVEEVEPHPSRLVRVVINVMPDVTGSRAEAAPRTPVTPSDQQRSSGCCRTFSGGLAALTAQAPFRLRIATPNQCRELGTAGVRAATDLASDEGSKTSTLDHG